ncbi:MAG TPA: glycosyltransferase family 2 protein [Thermoanaerobaculia bacterium]|nr:glycosyltransferase family 2 protein [Thermoanaerobaculia bacterium]
MSAGLGRVTVAVLSWNGRAHLASCLEALAAQQPPGVDWEVSILDNGSDDGTAEWLEREYGAGRRLGANGDGRLRWRTSGRNTGFCEGNNRLVEDSDADAVVLLNNDTRPEPGWLGELVEALGGAPPDVAAMSGTMVDWEARRLDFARGAMTFDGHAFQLDHRRALERVELPADGSELLFACGGNMIVRRDRYRAAGGFDPRYFAYLEDVDLGWRLWAGGERVTLARRAVVRHRSMASSQALGTFNRGILFERNAFVTAATNYDDDLWPRLMPAVLLTLVARVQWLLTRSNPGGETLAEDPYAATGSGAASPPPQPTWLQKWRGWGTRELARRGVRKLRRRLAVALHPELASGDAAALAAVDLRDPRTIAHLRAVSKILVDLDGVAARRARLADRRRRPDREIFERFPLLLVPTYPGDEELFASRGFRAWLPTDLPIVERTLEQIMELDG